MGCRRSTRKTTEKPEAVVLLQQRRDVQQQQAAVEPQAEAHALELLQKGIERLSEWVTMPAFAGLPTDVYR
jgi:hypothetical protein